MWSKNYNRGRWTKPASRPRPTRSLGAAVARAIDRKAVKRYDWVQGLANQCQWLKLPMRACLEENVVTVEDDGLVNPDAPPNAFRFSIVDPLDPSQQETALEDVTVVKVEGYIDLVPYFRPWVASGTEPPEPDCLRDALNNGWNGYFVRAGLKKDQFVLDSETGLYTSPARDPLNDDDWTDGRFIKTWQFSYQNEVETDVAYHCQGSLSGPCPDGEGNCNDALVQLPIAFGAAKARVSRGCPNIKLRLTSRRRIRLRESEGYSVWVNWTNSDLKRVMGFVDLDGQLPNAVGFAARASFKVLLER